MPTTETLVLLAIAAMNFGTAVLAIWTNRKVKEAAADIMRVEKATNSMQVQMLESAGREGHAAGLQEGRDEKR